MHFMGVLVAFGVLMTLLAAASTATTVDVALGSHNIAHQLAHPVAKARRFRALLREAPTRRPTPRPTAATKSLAGAKPAPTRTPTLRPTAAPGSAAKTPVLQALVGTTAAVTKAATLTPVGSSARVAGTLVTVTTAAATTTIAAASFDRYRTALRMRGTAGQLAFAVTTAGSDVGRVDTFAVQLTAGASSSRFSRCSALPVTVSAYRDFTSCAAYASYVKSLGGTAKEAANCVNNLRRVLLFKKKYSVPIAGTLNIAEAALHDFTTLDLAVDSACSMHALAVNSMTAGIMAGQPTVTRRQMAD